VLNRKQSAVCRNGSATLLWARSDPVDTSNAKVLYQYRMIQIDQRAVDVDGYR
jgi:hypothetical protein